MSDVRPLNGRPHPPQSPRPKPRPTSRGFVFPRKELPIENHHLTPILITGGATLTALLLLRQSCQKPASPPSPALSFNDENLTERFISAIPELTQELNLELATATFNETFTKESDLTTCWGLIDLGTSTAQVQVPVTYRYHLRLRERWQLELKQRRLIVHAPVITPSLPPAIHTDRLTTLAVRGWARGSTGSLLAELQQSLTPTLNQFAGDARHLELVRPQCRASVAEFVRLWLEREGQAACITQITVRFADETPKQLTNKSQP